MRRLTLLLLLIFLNLCIGCSSTENFESHYDSWVGGDVQELLKAWKEPDKVNVLQNGNLEYVFNITKKNNPSLPEACVLYFEVDGVTKKILHIRHEGTLCKRAPSFV
jgi:hypothetical protein